MYQHRDAAESCPGILAGNIKVKELIVKRLAVWNVRCRCGADDEDFLWAGPVGRELGLEHDGVGASLGILTDD